MRRCTTHDQPLNSKAGTSPVLLGVPALLSAVLAWRGSGKKFGSAAAWGDPGALPVYGNETGDGMRDSTGFDEFYRDTSARMVRYGYALTGDLGEAQDLVQEAYTRAWRQWGSVAAHPAPDAWIRLVLARLATDRRRRLRGWWAALSRTGPPEPARPPAEDTVLVTAALRQLPDHLRQALALHYLFDLPVAELAEETGAAVGTVTSWLVRGRREMAALLTDPAAPAAVPTPRGRSDRRSDSRVTRLEEATDVE